MSEHPDVTGYDVESFRREAASFLSPLRDARTLDDARRLLFDRVTEHQFDTYAGQVELPSAETVLLRDCARVLRGLFHAGSDVKADFSVTEALWDVARGRDRPDLGPGFFADMIHLVRGIEGRASYHPAGEIELDAEATGREAARARSRELDEQWRKVEAGLRRFTSGLEKESRARRSRRRKRILAGLGAGDAEWGDWKWQVQHVLKEPDELARLVPLSGDELTQARRACAGNLPFGVTPYYASLMDEDPEQGRDRAVRAQVLPPVRYVDEMLAHRGDLEHSSDFMLEQDTSPVDLVTRRYPGIVILKPFSTCPQICVYCQRNWEIEKAMAPHALATPAKLEAAYDWIARHPAIREVLVTGGDPLTLPDAMLERIMDRLASIEHVDLIRIGSRTPVTIPMRFTDDLVRLLASYRAPARREVCLVTHVEHPYELTPELVEAVDRLRRAGIAVYNQLVFTFFVSRRFEAATLRVLLRRIGVDPYYTFLPKGKSETHDYRVPIARLLQEQKEETRLLPGLRRSDEIVYNVPGLGKNHLRARQHRDLISILPDGTRVYEFHPWEKKIMRRRPYVGTTVPILDYLERLRAAGEDPGEYSSIWYYF